MLEFSSDQGHVADIIAAGKSIIINGSAGCGKTAVIKPLQTLLEDRDVYTRRIHKSASSGIAALELNAPYEMPARTVSSYLRLGIYDYSENEIVERNNDRYDISNGDIFVVDEAYGLSREHMQQINIALQTITGNDKSFGGCQMVFLGDSCQLKSEYGTPWENDPLIQNFETVSLDYSFRHENDPEFLEHLNWLRDHIERDAPLNLSSWWHDLLPHLSHVYETAHLILSAYFLDARSINEKRQANLATGNDEIILHPSYYSSNPPEAPYDELRLSGGTPIVHILNRNGLVNGSRGTVIAFDEQSQEIIIEDDAGTLHQIRQERIVNRHSGGETYFHPLLPAFALTARKVQGMTLPRGTISPELLSDDTELRRLYTAMSRFTHRGGISYLSA